jgi:PAS domain S-box-containing protein
MKTINKTTGNGHKPIQQLAQSGLELLPLIMNNIPQAVFWKDRNLVYLGCNRAFAEDTGFSSPEEVIGKTDFDMPWKKQAELYRADDQLVMESGEAKLNYEELQTTPDGSTIWLSTSKIPMRENGQVVAVLGMYEDITVRKRAEQAIKESEEEFKAIADNTAVGVFIYQDGIVRYVGREAARLLGYDVSETIGRSIMDFIHPDERQHIADIVRRRTARENVPDQYETRMLKKDGSALDVLMFGIMIEYEGKPATQGAFLDLTERKQAEEAIRESQDRFRQFSEATIEGLVFHEQGTIVDANPAATAMFGFSDVAGLIGRNLLEFVVPDSHELVLKQMRLESVQPYEIQGMRKDGSTFPMETSTRAYKTGKRTIRASSLRDVTERRQAAEFLQSMLENSPEAIGIVDLTTGLFTDLNENSVKLFGLPREELVKVGPAQMSPPVQPDGRPSTEKAMEKINAAMQGVNQVFEWTHRNARGENIPCEVRLARLPGDRPRVRFSVTDITERKRAEAALKESEARYSAVVNQANDGVIIIQDNIAQFVNQVLGNLLGYTPDEMVGMPFINFVAPESKALLASRVKARLAGEEVPPVYEARLQRKDGTIIDAELSAGVIQYRGKSADVGIIRDITERKRADEVIRESEERFRRFTEATNEGLVFHEQGKIMDANPAALAMFGLSDNKEILGKSLLEFVLPEDHALILKQMQLETVSPYEAQCVRKNGTTFPIETSTRTYKTGDRTVRATSIHDITERKRLEAQIRTAFERRGLQVQLSTQVSQSIAAATGLEDLYQRVVTQVKEQFGYYHVQLLRYDASQNAVVLITGYGDTGAKMLSAGHRLPMGQGLIGTAAASGETVLRPALTNDPDWHPNPLLPETKGEIAVPIKLGDNILGVLDVQSNLVGALNADDQLLLEGLCGQIATAIESTRLRQEMGERLEETNRLYQAMSHEGWRTYREASGVPEGFMFDQSGLKPIKDVGLAEELFSTLPLTVLGGEVIGTLAVADDPQRPISPEDQTFLQQVSEQVALALESARLFEQTQSALNESKEAEKAVRASEAQLSEALDIAKLANWEYDVERDRFTFNDHFYSIFHTTVEQMGGYELSSAEYAQRLVHPDDVPVVGAAIEKALASTDKHYSTQLEHRVIYADGGIGYISVEIHIERDDQGKITRYYGANQDITERSLAEEAVRDSEARLSEALDIAKLANWQYDVERDRFLFNDHFYSIFHTTAEAMGGYELSSAEYAQRLVYPEDLPVVGAAIEKALASTDKHYSTQLEHRVAYADGGMGYISVDIHIDRDDQGKIVRYYGANQDITERKLAGQAIAKRATELQTVAEVSTTTAKTLEPDRLLQTVVDVTKERFNLYHAHIYLADDAWKTLLLAAGAGEVGRKMVAEEHSIALDAEKSLVARAAREQQAVIVNDVRDDPSFLPNPLLPETRSEMAVPMIVADKVLGVFDVQSDRQDGFTKEDANIYTTLASQVAVALQNARLYIEQAAIVTQLRELDRLKNSFLANMSHELRTPLNSILGFSDVIIEGLDGPVTEQMDNDLRLIGKNGQHLLHLINDVLDMAKIDAGRMNLQPEKFKLNELFEEAINITSSLAGAKSLSLVIKKDSDRKVEVFADRTRLQQVMINLINNAIKFTERGKVALSARQKEDHVLIEVHDTGIGIPPGQLQTIFQEFTQVDSSATRKTGGTGLGLPISRRLVELHGGRLWAESTGVSGEGSTFYIELPLIAKIAEPIEKKEK